VGAVAGEQKRIVAERVAGAITVTAPDLFIAEVTNGLWKYVIAQQLTIGDAVERLDAALKMVSAFRPVADLAEESLREAATRRHPAYDFYYAVLARREGAAILTLDRRLKQLCTAMGIPLAME
jgi:predicted nucleic acid-binding protein